MVNSLYNKKNGSKIDVWYPVHGRKNVLRRIQGLKTRSFTGPNGRGVECKEVNGNIRCLLENKTVLM